MKPSQLWSAAAKAAEDALPIPQLGILMHFDAMHRKWMRQGSPCDPGDEVVLARHACCADPLVAIVMDLRGKATDARYLERYGRPLLTPEQAAFALREGQS